MQGHADISGACGARTWVWILTLAVLLGFTAHSKSAVVSWKRANGSSWATASNWNNGTGPSIGDTANFTNTGSVTLPNTATSILNANRTIGGLSFSNTSGNFHSGFGRVHAD
jgi:hypothetical protein